MHINLLTFTIIFFASISNNLFALEKGSWTLTKDNDWCYIGSLPIKSDLPETKKRGESYNITISFIRKRIRFILLRTILESLRGSRELKRKYIQGTQTS